MKILLLQPPIQDFYETAIRLQPIGLCYLKAAVRRHIPEAEVLIRDYHQGWRRKTIPLPSELAYLKPYYSVWDKSPFSTFFHFYHFGASFETIAREITEIRPDLVGISSLFSPYYREALRCAEIVKSTGPIPVLLGGSHVSAMPEQTLKHPAVDFIIRGEGERPLVEFLKAWTKEKSFKKVPNLGWKSGEKMILNPVEDNFPLEDLPFPDLSDFSSERYALEKKPLCFIITSRSCPHRCTFCSVHQTFGLKFRRRSKDSVLNEIRLRYRQGYRVFDFEDDNLTYFKEEMKHLCRDLIREFPQKDIEFVAMNGISYLSLDQELLKLMKAAGFSRLNLALVTSDTTVRETTKRPHTVEKYLEIVQEAHRLGFQMVSYQILGLPSETLESMIQTLVFNARLPVLLGASLFYLTPHSPIAREFPEPSETDVFRSRLTAMAVETGHFSREDLYTLFITTRILNFLKGLTVPYHSIELTEALSGLSAPDRRTQLGCLGLKELLETGVLYARTENGKTPISRFRKELFFEIWDRLGKIQTTEGKEIRIPFNLKGHHIPDGSGGRSSKVPAPDAHASVLQAQAD